MKRIAIACLLAALPMVSANLNAGEGRSQVADLPGWPVPPEPYAGRTTALWGDEEAIHQGRIIYGRKCAACHGWDGRGTGRMAESLPFPPADLTRHFHRAGRKGDDYLFWRVSEGGMVEPYRSMRSVMPAFKGVLTERERWEVLVYVHSAFHGGGKDGTGVRDDDGIPDVAH